MDEIIFLLNAANDLRCLADKLQAMAESLNSGTSENADPNINTVSFSVLRENLAQKCSEGKTYAVRELLQKYNACKLSDIDLRKHPSFFSDIQKL